MGDKTVRVAVGVIVNEAGDVLVAKRPEHVHQGGMWEFPGGKVELGETAEQALRRELAEELDILVCECRPIINIHHDYADKSVLLEVWEVHKFSGMPKGNEGQPVRWVARDALSSYAFPLANRPIVAAIRLPDRLLITGEAATEKFFIRRLMSAIERGISLLQLRAPALDTTEFLALFDQVSTVCQREGVGVIANTSVHIFAHLDCQGLHVNSRQLHALQERPVADDLWFSAACHSLEQIKKATQIGADFITLSPVLPTDTHPNAVPLGWETYAQWAEQANMPVYALGGLSAEHIPTAQSCGGQGIAAISAFW